MKLNSVGYAAGLAIVIARCNRARLRNPKAYTKPWIVKINQRVMLGAELIEFICEDRDAAHYVGAK